MKRLPWVAIGVALCAFATNAEAQSGRMRLGAHDGYGSYADGGDWDSDDVQPRATRRSARYGKRRYSGERGADWTYERPSRRRAARSGRRGRMANHRPVNTRGFVNFSRSAGTSRTCLSPAALGLLARIEAQFGSVGIISTCRPGARIAGSGRPSRHASGNAIDFNAPSGKKSDMVRWLIANHRAGGVMTYSDMGHIHVDIGHRFVALGSPSGGRRRWR